MVSSHGEINSKELENDSVFLSATLINSILRVKYTSLIYGIIPELGRFFIKGYRLGVQTSAD